MPSSPSPSLGLEEQATGENVNVWGVLLDRVIAMIDASVAGLSNIALTGNHTLDSTNYVANEARNAILKLTTATAPWTVTIPSLSKVYVVWNATTAIQTLTTGAGVATALQVGEIALLMCDAVNVARVVPTVFGAGPFSMAGALDLGGAGKITRVLDPTSPQDVVTKAYADALAFAANAGILPGQVGSTGFALIANLGGVGVAGWKQLTSADLSDTAARDAADIGRAVAFAVAL